MAKKIQIQGILWKELVQNINEKLKQGSLDKPIVYALYSEENDHQKIISYREIENVKVKGEYPLGDYDYYYPGIKEQGFYSPKGSGKWFSGTLVVGDGIELDEGDKKWMIRDNMDFRVKMVKDSREQLSWEVYCIDFPAIALELQ